jgi:hypothetical protein
MTKQLVDNFSHIYDFVIVFANTGQENEKTLVFVDRCAREWGLDIVWVEAVVFPGARVGTKHRVVSFETAARRGEPFEAVIEKYGIPNRNYPHCTRELKQKPIHSYLRSIGWKLGEYQTAIGIRTDETRRVGGEAKYRIVYPLIDLFPTDKQDVNAWFEQQPFNLGLREHEGNCSWCWKKTLTKHARLIKETPEIYSFPRRMERIHALTGSGHGPRVFFRTGLSTDQLFALCDQASALPPLAGDDAAGGCGESCEMYSSGAAA